MREILRIQHGQQDDYPEEALFDYNLELYEGDILYIQGDRGSGLKTLIKILAGDLSLRTGGLYLWDGKAEDYSRNTAMQYGLCMITGGTDMVMNMSVADNLEAVRPIGFPLRPYHRSRRQSKIQRYLDERGMHISAGDYVFRLSRAGQMQLSILKAQMHGARLIGLDMTENKYEGKEAEKICSLIQQVNGEGVSFILFAEDYSVFAETADRIQVLFAGRELKEWRKPWGGPERMRKRLHRNLCDMDLSSSCPQEGFLGLYDGERENGCDPWGFFETVKENNLEIWERYIDAKLPGQREYETGKTLVIPMEIGEMLFSNLSLADNIILTVPERVCGSRYGMIRKSVRENIVQRFYRRFQIEDSVSSIEELGLVYRKILGIYRWELAKPEVIFLENPYSGLTGDEKKIMTDYLRELNQKKMRIVLLSGSLENLKEVCGKIVVTKNGKSAKITTI